MSNQLRVIEICAGAGGQALGLERAGFEHDLAIELDASACATLRANRPSWEVLEGDVADSSLWKPEQYRGIDLLAGGVPCPPFTIAGKQLGATDERDLFAWSVELTGRIRPRALLLENVRGLSSPRFAGYRQHVLDRLVELGYVAQWKLLHASDFNVPQLRPRFVLVAINTSDAPYFAWPEPQHKPPTVGEALLEEMSSFGWEGAEAWAKQADDIAPTIVGGSKKHGGADLGPTRAKRAWASLGVDALGVANEPPSPGDSFQVGPKLTIDMVSILQGWKPQSWTFMGRKTSRYRQIGNAFPPPVAAAVALRIHDALENIGEPRHDLTSGAEQDVIYRALRAAQQRGDVQFLSHSQIEREAGVRLEPVEFERRIALLNRDFDLHIRDRSGSLSYKLGDFKAFTGQAAHERYDLFSANRSRIS